MYIIEPCCAPRQLMLLRDSIAKGGTEQFQGFGDLSLTELLPAIMTRYSETELLIAAPSIPDQAAEVIRRWMKQQWARRDGSGKLDAVRHLSIIADLGEEQSPAASLWLKDNPFGDRLTLVDRQQAETAILLPDFAVTGPVNMRYGRHFTATVTTVPAEVKKLWDKFSPVADAGEKEESRQFSRKASDEEPFVRRKFQRK